MFLFIVLILPVYFITKNIVFSQLSFTLAMFSACLAVVPLSMAFSNYAFPKFKTIVGSIFTLAAVLFTVWMATILKTGLPEFGMPAFIPGTGLVFGAGLALVGMNPQMGMIHGIDQLFGMLPLGIMFLREAIVSQEKRMKIRSLLLGFGFVFCVINGILSGFIASEIRTTIFSYFIMIGYLLVFAGVLYKIEPSPGVKPNL